MLAALLTTTAKDVAVNSVVVHDPCYRQLRRSTRRDLH